MSKNKDLFEEIITLLNEHTRLINEPTRGIRWREIRNTLVADNPEWNRASFSMKLTRTLQNLVKEGDIEKDVNEPKNVRYRISQEYINKHLAEPSGGLLPIPAQWDNRFIDPDMKQTEDDFQIYMKNKRNATLDWINYYWLDEEKLRKTWKDYWESQNKSI